MKKFIILATLLLSACATQGALYHEVANKMDPIKPGYGRVFVFRDAFSMGSALQPEIYFDKKKIGEAIPNSFIIYDVPAGVHTISASTETEESFVVHVTAGKETFIKTWVTIGVLLGRPTFKEVPAEEGRESLKDLHRQETVK
jgi:hypothetical protein